MTYEEKGKVFLNPMEFWQKIQFGVVMRAGPLLTFFRMGFAQNTFKRQVDLCRRERRGKRHWMHVHPPPPTWEKSSAKKCPKEERKFRPGMSAKKNVHVLLRYNKIKTKKVGKKEENSKRKGLKLKK